MDEPVVSEFSTYYYASAVIGAIVIIMVSIILVCIAMQPPITTGNFIVEMLLCLLLIGGYCFKLLISFRTISVTEKDVTIYYSLTKTQTVIDYAAIDKVYPYRGSPSFIFGSQSQSLIIEMNDGKEISFNYQDYNNYDELKAALYKYKLGIGA